MTTKEFKDKYPHYSHLEGDDLWNAMENHLLDDSTGWTGDYSEGYEEEFKHTMNNGMQISWRHPKHWVNTFTNERLTNAEFDSRFNPPIEQSTKSIESYRFDILDFGTNDIYPKILFSE